MAAGGIGAQLSQPPVTLINTGNAVTQKHFQPILVDSVFKPSVVWWLLTHMGRRFEGDEYGGSLVWPVVTIEEATGGAYWGAQPLDTSVTDSAQPAELQWRAYQQAIVIPVLDAILNMGDNQVLNLFRVKEEISFASMLQKLSRAIYAVAPQNTAIDLDGIPTALAASGSYAGITLANPWFSNGGTGPTSAGTITDASLETDYLAASFGNEEPDIMIMTNTGYASFRALLTNIQRLTDDLEQTRFGFRSLMYNNAGVYRDLFCPAGEVDTLTSKYVWPLFHPADHFRIDPFVQPTNQRVVVSHIWVTMNLQFFQLRAHSRHTGFTNG